MGSRTLVSLNGESTLKTGVYTHLWDWDLVADLSPFSYLRLKFDQLPAALCEASSEDKCQSLYCFQTTNPFFQDPNPLRKGDPFFLLLFLFLLFPAPVVSCNSTSMGRLSTIQRRTHCPSSTCIRGWNSKVQVEVWCVLCCILCIMGIMHT